MNDSDDRLYRLLPAVYRQTDAEKGYPLRALLRIIAEQVDVVEEDIRQLYMNWFIETCEDWVIPYIGDLIGYRPVSEAGEPGSVNTPAGLQRNKILISRKEVANTIHYRRRKGTLALLEILAKDIANWPARAVEFYRLLGLTQNINHLHFERGATADLRRGDALDRLDGPFDEVAHTIDVRRINSSHTHGRYNIPSLGLFVWRLKSYSITKTPAHCKGRQPKRFRFSILGNDMQLFTKPIEEPNPTHIADEMNVPAPIKLRAFSDRTEDYYGVGKSLCIWRGDPPHPVLLEDIVPADLSLWSCKLDGDRVAVDPRRGRILLSKTDSVWVTYHYGFSTELGGGEYDRSQGPSSHQHIYSVGRSGETEAGPSAEFKTVSQALDQWYEDKDDDLGRKDAIIEIIDNGEYAERLYIYMQAGDRLELRAANGKRPVLRLLDEMINTAEDNYIHVLDQAANITDRPGGRLILNGLLISNCGLSIEGELSEVLIRHCTLVPGWSVVDIYSVPGRERDSWTDQPDESPCIVLNNTTARLTVEHSIIGTILVDNEKGDLIPIRISDSIIDSTDPHLRAIGSNECVAAQAFLTIMRSTVLGPISIHAIELAENCIFNDMVQVARRRRGCMRFCYVPPGSRTPRRFNCQPDLVEKNVEKDSQNGGDLAVEKEEEQIRVRPKFVSMRYGTPAYFQLDESCAQEIKRGADDQSEMGIYHDLYQPQREANMRVRLAEFTPADIDVDIIFVS